MIFEHTQYPSFLKSVLVERVSRNPSYSLRAMARDLGLTPAHLSTVFKGTKHLSQTMALKVARRLELAPEATDYFCLLVQHAQARSPELKSTIQEKLRAIHSRTPVRDLSVDLFKTISEWYHIPILILTDVPGADFRPAALAKRFGISSLEAELALERLERLELLNKDESGRYTRAIDNGIFRSAAPNGALRNYHTQMLQKAVASLSAQEPAERYIGSETFALDPARIEEARPVIDEFRRRLVEQFGQGGEAASAVYHLEVILFNLTPKGEKQS